MQLCFYCCESKVTHYFQEEMMTETRKKMHTGKLALIWCGVVILIGALIFALLSAFGALRFWQAEKTPQGETDLAFEAVDLPFVHKRVVAERILKACINHDEKRRVGAPPEDSVCQPLGDAGLDRGADAGPSLAKIFGAGIGVGAQGVVSLVGEATVCSPEGCRSAHWILALALGRAGGHRANIGRARILPLASPRNALVVHRGRIAVIAAGAVSV
jgi:hypothetical protein